VRFIIAIFVVGLSTASAAPGDGIIVESYSGQRPADANRLLSPVLDELANRGYVAGPEVVGRRFEQRVSRPSIVAGGLPPGFADQVDKGHKAWIGGRFDEAVKLLTPLVDAAHANSGAFAQTPALREKLLKALIALALSHQRIGDQDATRATFGEILRSFPNEQISRQSYGPDAFNLFEEVKRQAMAGGKGKLVIKATNQAAVVFINEQYQGTGNVTKTNVLPGEYRIFVGVGTVLSRVHRVNVVANADDLPLVIDADFDALVHSSPEWTGFLFPDQASREKHESVYAAAFANAINARGIVIVGFDTVRGKQAIFGSLVSLMNGREVRRASINLDPDPSVDKLRALAKFIAGDNAAPGIDIQLAGDLTSAGTGGDGQRVEIGDLPRSGPTSDPMWGGWKWLTGAVGLGGIGVGAYLLSIDGDCNDDACTYYREASVSGWVTLGGGALMTGLSVYLFVRGSGESSSQRSAFVVPTRGGAYAGYALRF
jgi:hypothetical protein